MNIKDFNYDSSLTPVDRHMLDAIADMTGVPEGALNIRKNGQGVVRFSSPNIEIKPKTDNPGIDIIVKPGTKGEEVHIPVILTEEGVNDLVYNLCAVCHKFFKNVYLCTGSEVCVGLSVGRVNSLYLDHLHLTVRVLFHVYDGGGIENSLSLSVTLAIVLPSSIFLDGTISAVFLLILMCRTYA